MPCNFEFLGGGFDKPSTLIFLLSLFLYIPLFLLFFNDLFIHFLQNGDSFFIFLLNDEHACLTQVLRLRYLEVILLSHSDYIGCLIKLVIFNQYFDQ